MKKHTRFLGVLGLLILLGILSNSQRAVQANGFFIVNSTDDTNAFDNVLTLREAILVSNGSTLGTFSAAEKDQLGGCLFSGSGNAWTIVGGCGTGIPDTIGFSGDIIIQLSETLPVLADNSTVISALTGQDVQVNGNGVAGGIFNITGSDIIISNLKLYGITDGATIIFVSGAAQRVEIANNVIGDDDAAGGSCDPNSGATYGIFLNATGSISSGARAWIYGNVIECVEFGSGINVVNTDEVIIGEDFAGNAGDEQRNIIRFNGSSGVRLSGGSGNVVRNSNINNNGESGVHITDSDLNRVFGNTIAGNGDNGVEIVNGSSLNRIGCPAGGFNNATYRNHIRNNTNEGVWIYGGLTANNSINCNWIGLTAAGNGAAGNGRSGVFISGGAHSNFIGINESTQNIISGNGRFGVEIMGIDTDNNGVYGNYIGTNVAGDTAVPNLSGIVIALGASNNRVGDVSNNNGGKNLISGNSFFGIFIGDADTINNRIEGNAIGNHNEAPANGLDGIRIVGANLNIIGDHPDNGYTQYIEGNGRNGIRLEDSNQTIIGQQNVITYNEGAGIVVTGSSSQNDLWPRQISHNGGLPFDLGDDGHTPNDPGDGDSGPNHLLNYPEVTDVNGDIVTGIVCGGCTVRLYFAQLNPSQPGGGGTYMHSVTADFEGNWSANLNSLNSILADFRATDQAPQGGVITADQLTYTAVQSFNTSEMAPRSLNQVFLPMIVNNAPLPSEPDLVWFAPNMGSRDYTDLFSHPEQWLAARSKIDVFKFYPQLLLDAPCSICGNNTLDAMLDVQAFQRLTDWGIAIGVEASAVKEWGCTGETEYQITQATIDNIQANSGVVTYLAMDEPYIGGEHVFDGLSCHNTMAESADATNYFVSHIRAANPQIVLGDIEPYPYFTVSQLQNWLLALETRGVQLDFFHLDVDIERAEVEGQDVATDLWALRQFCQAHGIPFGVIFTSNWTEAGSELGYFTSTMGWIDTVKGAMGMPSQVIFQSWQGPAPDGVHAVPINLPEDNLSIYSHTRLINEGLTE